jgi:hypothetical protein
MKLLLKLLKWISRFVEYVDELAPKPGERRTQIERRKLGVGYDGPERRSGLDRRAKK